MSKKLRSVKNVGEYKDTDYKLSDFNYNFPNADSINRHGVDVGLYYLCAWLSNYAYFDVLPTTRLQEMGAKRYKLIKSDNYGTEALVVSDGIRCFTVFRGTKERIDIKTDALFIKKGTKYGRTSIGPTRALEDITQKLYDYYTAENLWELFHVSTGHSLGGGLANLFAPRFIDERKKHTNRALPVPMVPVIAPPRIGGLGFARSFMNMGLFDKSGYVINNNDTVPRKPYKVTAIWHFIHPSRALLITSDKKIVFNPKRMIRIIDRIKGFIEDAGDGDFDLIADHDMDQYIIGLGENLHNLKKC